jgi:hypothetical protein
MVGQLDVDRTRRSAVGHERRAAQRGQQARRVVDAVRGLHQAAYDGELVELLEGAAAPPLHGGAGRQEQHGGRGLRGFEEPGDGVGHRGALADQGDTEPAGLQGVAGGHEDRVALVAAQDEADVRVDDRFEGVHVVAGEAEDGAHAELAEDRGGGRPRSLDGGALGVGRGAHASPLVR